MFHPSEDNCGRRRNVRTAVLCALDAAAVGHEVILGVRPEHMARARDGLRAEGHVRLETVVELIQPTGSRTYITFPLGKTSVMAEVEPHDVQRPGEPVAIDLDLNRAVLIDPQTSRVL